jgi:hypothetical protein
MTAQNYRPSQIVCRETPVPADRASKYADARDRVMHTWGENLLTNETARTLNITMDNPITAQDQFDAFKKHLPCITPSALDNLNFCTMYETDGDLLRKNGRKPPA